MNIHLHVTVKRSPRWTRRPADRPDEILDAAQSVFIQCGYGSASMGEIARRAGVSPGLLYRYFRGKEALFLALVRRLAERVTGELRRQLGAQGAGPAADWPTRLTALAARMYEHISHPRTMGLFQLALGEGHRLPELSRIFYREVVQRVEEIFTAQISQAMREGALRHIDPVVAHRAFAGMMLICAMERRIFRSRRRHLRAETLIPQLIGVYLSGLLVERQR